MKTTQSEWKINNLILNEIKEGDAELADAVLTEMGFDPNQVKEYAEKIKKRQNFRIRVMINKRKDTQLQERASRKIHEMLTKNTDRPVAFLKGLFEQNEIVCMNNKLEKLDVEEIKEMIKDMNYLELLERLEKENEEEQ